MLLAVGCTVLAISEHSASAHVQGSDILAFVEPEERCAQLVSLGASSTEVAAATADGRVLLWKLVDRTLLAIFPAFTVLDFENLSWSVGQAEMAFPAQLTQMVVLEEVLVVACNLGQPGDASAGCVLTAWHTSTGTRLPHPWHLAGPLEASASRHSSSIPVFLPGRLVGQMAADPSLRWLVASFICAGAGTGTVANQAAACIVTRSTPKSKAARC